MDLQVHRRGHTELGRFNLNAARLEGAGAGLVGGEQATGIPQMGTRGGQPREPGNGLCSGGHEGRTLLLDELWTISHVRDRPFKLGVLHQSLFEGQKAWGERQ